MEAKLGAELELSQRLSDRFNLFFFLNKKNLIICKRAQIMVSRFESKMAITMKWLSISDVTTFFLHSPASALQWNLE